MTKRLQTKYKLCKKIADDIWSKKSLLETKYNTVPKKLAFDPKEDLILYYAKRLQTKQQLKYYYGKLTETYFKNTYTKATKLHGLISNNFVILLECRLDNVIYRLNLTESIFKARQLVNHKHIKLNNNYVNIPSILVNANDLIEVDNKNIQAIIFNNMKKKYMYSLYYFEKYEEIFLSEESHKHFMQFLINTYTYGNPNLTLFHEYYITDIIKPHHNELKKKAIFVKKAFLLWEELFLNYSKYCPNFIEFNPQLLCGIIVNIPSIEDIKYSMEVNPKLIIEQYAK